MCIAADDEKSEHLKQWHIAITNIVFVISKCLKLQKKVLFNRFSMCTNVQKESFHY